MPVGLGADRHLAAWRMFISSLTSALLLSSASVVHSQDSVTRRPLGQDVPAYMPPVGTEGGTERPPSQNPQGPLSLSDAVALALMQNPDLAAFGWEMRAREARTLQAGRPPNPSLSTFFEDFGAKHLAGGGLNEPVQPQTTLQLSQLIELGGKRAARVQLAASNKDLAAWDYEAARINVLTEVTQAFTDTLAAQEMLTQAEQTIRLAEQVQESVGLRVVAGVVSPIEETRAGVVLASIRVEGARAHRLLDAQRTRLALLWGSSTAAFAHVVGNLKQTPAALPSFANLSGRLKQNPEIARWTTEMAQRQAAVAVERSKAVPDLSLSAGYRRFLEVDSNAFVVGASISLPFLDKNHAGIAEAQSRAAKAQEEQRAAETRVTAALATAYAALATAHDEVDALRSVVVPGSQQAFEAISEGYRLGRFGYLDVLESQRTLASANTQYVTALSTYYKALANVERLLGAPLADGTTSSAEDR